MAPETVNIDCVSQGPPGPAAEPTEARPRCSLGEGGASTPRSSAASWPSGSWTSSVPQQPRVAQWGVACQRDSEFASPSPGVGEGHTRGRGRVTAPSGSSSSLLQKPGWWFESELAGIRVFLSVCEHQNGWEGGRDPPPSRRGCGSSQAWPGSAWACHSVEAHFCRTPGALFPAGGCPSLSPTLAQAPFLAVPDSRTQWGPSSLHPGAWGSGNTGQGPSRTPRAPGVWHEQRTGNAPETQVSSEWPFLLPPSKGQHLWLCE